MEEYKTVKPKKNSILWVNDVGGNGILISINKQQKWRLLCMTETGIKIERNNVILTLNKYTFDLNFEICSSCAIENGQT